MSVLRGDLGAGQTFGTLFQLGILRTILRTARQWGELPEDAADPCTNIARNPKRSVARHLSREELERPGGVLTCAPLETPLAGGRVPSATLTGARLSGVLNLRWEGSGSCTSTGQAPGSQTPRAGGEPCGSDRMR